MGGVVELKQKVSITDQQLKLPQIEVLKDTFLNLKKACFGLEIERQKLETGC